MIKFNKYLCKNIFVIFTIFLFALITTGFKQPAIHMRIVKDNLPLRDLTEITGRCLNNGTELLLLFDAVNDPIELAIDDETFYNLEIRIDDISQLPLREPININDNTGIHTSASLTCFCPQPLEPLTEVTGVLTINSNSNDLISGTILVSFDADKSKNFIVEDSLKFWIRFNKLDCAGNN